jgi:hypothetical protein
MLELTSGNPISPSTTLIIIEPMGVINPWASFVKPNTWGRNTWFMYNDESSGMNMWVNHEMTDALVEMSKNVDVAFFTLSNLIPRQVDSYMKAAWLDKIPYRNIPLGEYSVFGSAPPIVSDTCGKLSDLADFLENNDLAMNPIVWLEPSFGKIDYAWADNRRHVLEVSSFAIGVPHSRGLSFEMITQIEKMVLFTSSARNRIASMS